MAPGSWGRRVAVIHDEIAGAGGGVRSPAWVVVEDEEEGVDIGAVSQALGLHPHSVRLNGYFISRGPGLVSASVKWGYLLSFFASRGLPAGESIRDPIVVQGNPVPNSPGKEERHSSKRKVMKEEESAIKKKNKIEKCSQARNSPLNDEDILCIKRRLKLEDDHPLKKRKAMQCTSGLFSSTPNLASMVSRTGFALNACINGRSKRLRENDMAPFVASKKTKPQFLVEN